MIEIIAYIFVGLACLLALAGIVLAIFAFASQVAYRDPEFEDDDDV